MQRLRPGADDSAALAQLPTSAARYGRSPVWLPGRQVVLYEISTDASSSRGRSIVALDLTSGSEKTVLEDAAQPAILPNENVLFLRGDVLYAVAFDAATLGPKGEPRVVVPSVQSGANSLMSQYATGGGRLLYLPGQNAAARPFTVVEWRGMTADSRLLISEPGTYRDLCFSPDGRRLAHSAFATVEATATDLFVYDLQRDVKIRLAGDPAAAEWRPVWTSDARFIGFSDYSPRTPGNGIHRVRADGSGQPEQITTPASAGAMQVPVSISPEGKYLAYYEQERNQPADIGLFLWILLERRSASSPRPRTTRSRVFSGWAMDRLCLGRVRHQRALHPSLSKGRRQMAGAAQGLSTSTRGRAMEASCFSARAMGSR